MIFGESDPYIFAAVGGLLLIVLLNLMPSKPRYATADKPWGVFDEHGVLWNRESTGLKTGKPQAESVAFPHADNAYAIMAAACVKGGDRLTAGKRKLIQRHWVEFNGKTVEKLTLADKYDFMTYKTFGETMHQIGCGFTAWAKCKPNDCILIYAET